MDRRFERKVVLVTGGGAGIGRTFARRFAAEGASIVIADREHAAADHVVAELAADGVPALAVAADVGDADAVVGMASSAAERFGGIDILINNAAVHLVHAQLPFEVEALPRWRHLLDVNVLGPLACAAACRPHMAGRASAAIINMSSMAAMMGDGAYGMSKLALNSLTLSLAAAFASDGIRVNGVAPGLVDSESATAWMNEPERAGVQQMLVSGQLIKRPGTMQDVADLALFLCSDAASFITGQTVLVDGGFTKKPV